MTGAPQIQGSTERDAASYLARLRPKAREFELEEDHENFIEFLRKLIILEAIKDYRRAYELDRDNPLPAWYARNLARRYGVPVPEWVERYLDACCYRITLSDGELDNMGLGTTEKHVRWALGMNSLGQGSYRTRERTMQMRLRAMHYFADVKAENPKLTNDQAFTRVALLLQERDGITRSQRTISNWYREMKSLLEDHND